MSQHRRSTNQYIRLRQVSQNNLKNFDLDLPIGQLVVVTGLSGAGKSSLVFETLHAEGNRRYVETFSPYARQFMEMMDRPKVGDIENIRPSIAVEQGNTVKTSRSTVGTMTELCDYFKVWFSHVASLYDPETGEKIEADTPQTVWKKSHREYSGQTVLVAFRVVRPDRISWQEILRSLSGQGYNRIVVDEEILKIDNTDPEFLEDKTPCFVIQDRVKLIPNQRSRFIEAAQTAFHFGEHELNLIDPQGRLLRTFNEGLHRRGEKRRFRPATPNLFSFNSPLGACSRCRGFGRIIELDERLVIPDTSLTLEEGAIKAFSGAVYSESQRDLMRACRKHGIPTNVPWEELSQDAKAFVMDGEPGYGENGIEWPHGWYGVRRFFKWLEENTYKMHVRVFLSRYRAYVKCPECEGARLQPEALCWKWEGYRLPDLYNLPIRELLQALKDKAASLDDHQADIAQEAILTRLGYLESVGLGYLTLNRTSRSLSGGETQRVNLTSCLGTSLVDTLFILDEPSIGLHCRDIDRLIGILRNLVNQGNTVVVVEHDEAIMQAADSIIEVGPRPGKNGGEICFQGSVKQLLRKKSSLTGQYLSGRLNVPVPAVRRNTHNANWLRLRDIRKHNLQGLDVDIPLERFVALSGVSGSGKSTLMHNSIYQGLLAQRGKITDDPAAIGNIQLDQGFGEIVLIDQSPLSRTPRSNPILFVNGWDRVRQLFSMTEEARSQGLTTSSFSFNSGNGRCPHCEGLGFERVEMQFMADIYVQCPICEGKRFAKDVLDIHYNGKNVAEILEMTVEEARVFFANDARLEHRLKSLEDVGLGYLPLGQPLNTLSGGESQRLKLVKYLGMVDDSVSQSLILLDEPTTGLHRGDISRLIDVLHALVDKGHSLVVIEHHPDVLKNADWIIELGPEAGNFGGELICSGTPEQLAGGNTPTAPFLDELNTASTKVAQPPASYAINQPRMAKRGYLEITGAREHNLKNISLRIPHQAITVVTGVSGSGKSTLAFDIVFAEGQRRFMESMSSWARQYVEQLPRPEIDRLDGIAPTVAIEQRVTKGTRKSTVATITEVAQYLRLLYARLGVQHSPETGEPLTAMPQSKLVPLLEKQLKEQPADKYRLYLCSPLIRGRKGHHEPAANWARDHGYEALIIDGTWTPLNRFRKLDRYREHDVDIVVGSLQRKRSKKAPWDFQFQGESISLANLVAQALRLGKETFYLADPVGRKLAWFSTKRSDPVTGEAFPELDPKHFSWNAAKGWCPVCRGHGVLHSWMTEDERFPDVDEQVEDASLCPECEGERLNPISRAVYLYDKHNDRWNLPAILKQTPSSLLSVLNNLNLDRRGTQIFSELYPEIEERLKFMNEVGLDYLSLERATNTLSGGEAQRIRLAAQLGSNLSGALYVLDEPSIGLHARDNDRLIQSLHRLKNKGNTLLVVEHDTETMHSADRVIDLGPGAGIHGGEILAEGSIKQISRIRNSLTGQYLKKGIKHPMRGKYRELPAPFNPRKQASREAWLVLEEPRLRNLKGGVLKLPKGHLIVVGGISGAGKSTLIRDLLKPAVHRAIHENDSRLARTTMPFKRLLYANFFKQVIEVDQSPIGKTPRSTPATYIGAFDKIRQHFANLPESRIHGYTPSTFSFNTKGGRCETCKGAGRIKLEMNFMPDTYIACEDCNESRYGPELSEVRWNGKNISEILQLSFEEAAAFFEFDTQLHGILQLMVDTGLGYLTLGQSSPTLSGGEAQRLKLVSELAKGLPATKERRRGELPQNLYILEEPTIGLHLHDVERLSTLLHRMVDQGHTVIVIEHHLDIIAEADYFVEIGPEGGEAGGEILFQGHPRNLANAEISPTRPFLENYLHS